MNNDHYLLRWNNHQPNFISAFSNLLNSECLVDVTLAAEGKYLQTHKVVLSACSSYFQTILTANPCQHPIVILKDVLYNDLKAVVDFMYCGEVNVSQEQFPGFLKTAEVLQVKGLADMPDYVIYDKHSRVVRHASGSSAASDLSQANFRRKKMRKMSTGSVSGTDNSSLVSGAPTSIEEVEIIGIPGAQMHHPMKQHSDTSGSEYNKSISSGSGSRDSKLDCSVGNELPLSRHMSIQSNSRMHPIHYQKSDESTGGSKRGRFLVRQKRIKREYDDENEADDPDSDDEMNRSHYLERQYSDPTSMQSVQPQYSSGGNMLTVPQNAQLVKQNSDSVLTNKDRVETKKSSSKYSAKIARIDKSDLDISTNRSNHCPALRQGPALGCNFCWNTIDSNGRILRRKTKYKCPECEVNLCIVPCFQDYHDKKSNSSDAIITSISDCADQSKENLTVLIPTTVIQPSPR